MKIIVVFMMAKYTGENQEPSYEIARTKPPTEKVEMAMECVGF